MANRGRKPGGPSPGVTVKLRFEGGKALGPGKVRLLELIDELGSIWAAGRSMKMSYGRAWNLSKDLNEIFDAPLIVVHHGGSQRGGALLTPLGRQVVDHYRSIENGILANSGSHLEALEQIVKSRPSEDDAVAGTPTLDA